MQNDVLANTNKRQRILMASKGENIEALIAKNEPKVIAKLIDYELSRDKNYVYLNSHSRDLRSAKFKIIGQDKQVIYVLYKDETYKIPVMVDKR